MRYSEVEQYPNEWLNTITHEDIEHNSFPVIVDRDPTDVNKVLKLSAKAWDDFTEEEKRWWGVAVAKGAYNDDDLNRVGYAVNHLVARLLRLPIYMQEYRAERAVASDPHFTVPYDPEDYANVHGKTTWVGGDDGDIPTESDMDTYLHNVMMVQDAIQTDPAIQGVPSTMENLSYVGANDIESTLQRTHNRIIDWTAEAKTLIDNTAAAFVYSGEVFAGEI